MIIHALFCYWFYKWIKFQAKCFFLYMYIITRFSTSWYSLAVLCPSNLILILISQILPCLELKPVSAYKYTQSGWNWRSTNLAPCTHFNGRPSKHLSQLRIVLLQHIIDVKYLLSQVQVEKTYPWIKVLVLLQIYGLRHQTWK